MICIIFYLLSVIITILAIFSIIYSIAIMVLAPFKIYLSIIHPIFPLLIWYSYILYSLIALTWICTKFKRKFVFFLFTHKGRRILLYDIKTQFYDEMYWLTNNRLSLIIKQIFIFLKNVIYIIFNGKRF